MPIAKTVTFVPYNRCDGYCFPVKFVTKVETILPTGEIERLQQLMKTKDTTNDVVYERQIFIELCRNNHGLSLSQVAALHKITSLPMGLYNPGWHLFMVPGEKSANKGARLLKKFQLFQALEGLGVIDRKMQSTGTAKVGEMIDEYEKARETANQMMGTITSEFNIPSLAKGKFATEYIGTHALNKLLFTGEAETIDQVEKIFSLRADEIKKYPMVQGFEESKEDPTIPNFLVVDFLFSAFGAEVLKQLRVDKIIKSDQYFIFCPHDNKYNKCLQWLKWLWQERKVFSLNYQMFYVDSRDTYLEIARKLEEEEDETKLSHIFCRLGTVNNGREAVNQEDNPIPFRTIRLFNFTFQHPFDHAYLMDLAEYSDKDKIRIHILSTIAHEIGHIYARGNSIDEYLKATEEERKEKPYVTDYIRLHAEIFKCNATLEDDFCESIRLYVSNAEYLRRNFPARYNYLSQYLPFIKANSARDAIALMNSQT